MTEVTAADLGSVVTPLLAWGGSSLTPPRKDRLISGWGLGRAVDVTGRVDSPRADGPPRRVTPGRRTTTPTGTPQLGIAAILFPEKAMPLKV